MAHVSTYQPWAEVEALADLPDAITDEERAAALQAATDVLFHFTRRKYPGIGETTIRPEGTVQGSGVSEVLLPYPPIVAVLEVKVDGDVVGPDAYRVDNDARLVRIDGHAWPSTQNHRIADTELGTFSVKYQHGVAPPPGGVSACIVLARQMALAFSSDADAVKLCQLPRRVTTISRQGVSLAVLDPLTLFERGLTGVGAVDLWVASDRYGSRNRGMAVYDTAGTAAPRWQDRRPRTGRRSRFVTPPPE